MDNPSLRALLIMAVAYLLCFAVFATQGVPVAEGGARIDSGLLAALAAAGYSLTSLAAIVFARSVLGIFVDFSRPVAFFNVLGALTDPFLALFRPVTPGFLHPGFHGFFAAFCLYFIKLLLLGGFGAPPPWVLVLFALGRAPG